jgi:hypothetical protein
MGHMSEGVEVDGVKCKIWNGWQIYQIKNLADESTKAKEERREGVLWSTHSSAST